MKVSKRRLHVKDSLSIIIQHVRGDHYISLIPVYEFLIKCELIVTSLHTRCCKQKANRCQTIWEVALKIKESYGLPDGEIQKSDTIFRGLEFPDYSWCRTLLMVESHLCQISFLVKYSPNQIKQQTRMWKICNQHMSDNIILIIF